MSNELTPDQAAFRQFELDGWKTSAPVYFDAIVGVNSQSVPALLDAAGVAAGVRVLRQLREAGVELHGLPPRLAFDLED